MRFVLPPSWSSMRLTRDTDYNAPCTPTVTPDMQNSSILASVRFSAVSSCKIAGGVRSLAAAVSMGHPVQPIVLGRRDFGSG